MLLRGGGLGGEIPRMALPARFTDIRPGNAVPAMPEHNLAAGRLDTGSCGRLRPAVAPRFCEEAAPQTGVLQMALDLSPKTARGIWKMDLRGHPFDLEALGAALGQTAMVERKGDQWFLTSPAFPNDALAHEVKEIAERLVEGPLAVLAAGGATSPAWNWASSYSSEWTEGETSLSCSSPELSR